MPDLDARLPSSLQALSETRRLGADVPSLVVRPEGTPLGGDRIPFLLWMHGRTATKELDPGRYLRLARAGIEQQRAHGLDGMAADHDATYEGSAPVGTGRGGGTAEQLDAVTSSAERLVRRPRRASALAGAVPTLDPVGHMPACLQECVRGAQ